MTLGPGASDHLRGLFRGEFKAPAPAGLPPEVEAAAQRPGASLGDFVLVTPLGSGGAGDVWKAWDRRLGRWVAIKLPKFAPGAANAWRRFQQEASAAARLNHPGIVPIYRIDEEQGRAFIVMGLVEGVSLDSGKLPLRDAVEAILQAARAADYAHSQGIVHRDIKPGNLMRDEKGRVYLLDFGLAHVQEAAQALTKEGSVLGTPAYMSPEQARGEPSAKRPATDVYGLGATLYELVTDRPPFTGRTFAEIVGKVAHADPPPPRSVSPSCPRDLETILLHAMEKVASRRYPGAGALADDLQRFLDGDPIEARAASSVQVLWRRAVKHRAVLVPSAAALVLAVALVLVLGVRSWTRSRDHAGHLADAVRHEKGGRPDLAAPAFKAALELDPDSREAREGLRRAQEALERQNRAAADGALRQRVESRLAPIRQALTRGESITYVASADLAGFRAELASLHGVLADVLELVPTWPEPRALRGKAFDLEGREEEAEAEYRKALVADPGYGSAHRDLGRLLVGKSILRGLRTQHRSQLGRVRDLAREAASHLAEAGRLGTAVDKQAGIQASLARILEVFGTDGPQATRSLLQEAVRTHGEVQYAEIHHLLLGLVAGPAERLAGLEAALRIRPHFPVALMLRARHHEEVGKPEEAEKDLDRVVESFPASAVAWFQRGDFRMTRNRPREAIEDYTAGLPRLLSERYLGFWTRARARRAVGDLAGAREDFDAALRLDPPSDSRSAILVDLGLLVAESDPREAIAWFNRALQEDAGQVPALSNRGIARGRIGDTAGAIEDLRQALKRDPTLVNSRYLLGHYLGGEAGAAEIERALKEAPPTWKSRPEAEARLRALREAK